ncbi:MAG: hypothetical protein N4A46_09495 [Schleiferiaceae bacterium]|jgi:hypothetical protein|nr:hypothetical protein [Schleiferiaceae bacterium]
MQKTFLKVLMFTLLLNSIAYAQNNSNKNNVTLELSSLALLRVMDNGSPLTINSAPISLTPSTQANGLVAGESAKNLFPFTSSSFYLQYTYIPAPQLNGNNTIAKITVTRSAFINPEFQTHTRLYITTKAGTYYSGYNAPNVAGGVNSGVRTKVVNTNNKRIIRDIYPGWTGIANTEGNEIMYSWELKKYGDPTALAGLSENVLITFTITEQ